MDTETEPLDPTPWDRGRPARMWSGQLAVISGVARLSQAIDAMKQ